MRSLVRFFLAGAATLALCLFFSIPSTVSAQSANQYRYTATTGASIVPGTTAVTNFNCGISPAGDDCVATIRCPSLTLSTPTATILLVVSTNGNIQFESANNDFGQDAVCFPLTQFRYVIAAYFSDLTIANPGEGIFTSVSGAAPNRIFNIEWRASALGRPAGSLNFEVRLYEGQTRFDIIYGTVPNSGLDATVGDQRANAENVGAFTQYECRTGGLRNGLRLTANGVAATSYILEGRAMDTEGNPLPGVVINLSGDLTASTVTDANGEYLFEGLNRGGNYTVSAVQPGSTFFPASRTFTFYPGNLNVIFTRTVLPEAGQILISEFRFRGPLPTDGSSSARDEFIELYNNTDTTFVVNTPDNSSGWALISSGTNATPIRLVIPRGTTLPPRTHYLAGNSSGYSLTNVASPDSFFAGDIADNSGIALVRTFNAANYEASGNRLDAVGFTPETNAFFREARVSPPSAPMTGSTVLCANYIPGCRRTRTTTRSDFIMVSPNAATFGSTQSTLGTPGPQNLTTPIQHNARVKAALVDPNCPGFGDAGTACARVRLSTSVTNGQFGTLLLRRKFTNTTGQRLTRLRFRIVDITTRGNQTAGQADLRALTSTDRNVTNSEAQAVVLRGVTLNQSGSQPEGGGLNSTLTAGAVTLGTPLAPNASINIEFRLGVQQNGGYRFFVNVEATTGGLPPDQETSKANRLSTKRTQKAAERVAP
jgi:hypothetical protein